MTPLSPGRRAACALAAVVGAAIVLHGQLALALVSRGDDALRAGDLDGAVRAYERARWFDPVSTVAADRLAFQLALRHDARAARRAIDVATVALRSVPSAANLLADRGFAEMQLRAWSSAERDFARAGQLAADPRYDHFAARMALRAGRRDVARVDEALALALNPGFSPARHLMRAFR